MAWEPLVSVVLPSRDRPERLARALRSVLAQDHRRLEVLVVDDASEVPARAVVERVGAGDDRVRVDRSERNIGAGAARNRALGVARGEVVAFLDDDDRWEPTKVRRQVGLLSTRPEVGIVTCHYRIERELGSGRATSGGGAVRAGGAVHRGPDRVEAGQLLWFNLPGSFLCGMVRREAVEGELWLDEGFPSVEDWDFWVRCARGTAIGVVPEVLAVLTVHGGGRRSDPASEAAGLAVFAERHGEAMSGVGRAYQRAHREMAGGTGWGHRAAVLRALASSSPRASALLLAEQGARQLGRLWGDPGLVERTLARLVPGEVPGQVAGERAGARR